MQKKERVVSLGLGRIAWRRHVVLVSGSAALVEVLEIGDVKQMRLAELKVLLACFQENVQIVLKNAHTLIES